MDGNSHLPHPTIIGCLYKPPNGCPSSFATALESSLFRVDPEHNIVIVGDLNATCPSWCSTDSYNEAGRILEPVLSTLNLYQHVSSPTHLRHDGSLGSLLDVIITNDNNNNVSAIKLHPPLGASDHLMVECKLSLHCQPLVQKKHYARKIWSYHRANATAVNNALENAFDGTWLKIRNAAHIDDAWTCWRTTFLVTVDKYIPHKVIAKRKPKNPFVTPEIEQLIKEKRYAYRRFKRNPSPELRLQFTRIRNIVTAKLRKAERAHATSLHRKTRVSPSAESSRDFWTFIRQLTGKTRKEPCSILIDPVSQQTVSSGVEKATLLNNYFVKQTMLDIPSNCKPDTASLPVNPNSFTFLETTPTEVYKILSTLKTNKAAGLDNIPAALLKFCAPGISKSLTCLFNRSFELSEFPTAWKEAMVIPIFKKGSHTDPGNYRPIALLPIISKVLERIVHDKLSSFLQTWLHDSQSGFKKGDGTVPQLLRLCQEWSRHVDNSAYVGILFFDLRKAFDRVWHDGLLSKLEAAGICGSAFAWMKSFLTSRRQITTVEGCTSAPAEIGAGVPQGAILSPLLFSVYVNDISSATPASNINLFADDTSAYVTSQAPSVLNSDLQTTADSLSSWFSRWHLSVHPAKTVCMVLRSTGMPPCQLNIKINGNHIAQVTRHRHLGVTFNERLSWKDHVHDVLTKSAKKIGLLRRLGRQLSSTVVRDLYAFSIRPGIEYGSIVWSGLSSSDAARLERLNRSAARLITKTSLSSDLSRELLLARAGLPSLSTRRLMAQCTLIRKAYLGRHPRHLQRALSPWISPGKRRQSPRTSPLSILVQRPNKSFFQRSPLFQAATTWNRFVAATASRDLPSARDIANFFEH